ncbi:hypothetical protein F383_22905 [Gossypium arboreum]|uniref:Uncharacterized protein n=1 Tax=Gossypium arboreum TaxID=29729 RepID=A0A0B0P3N7_GOSAR|nr:hypothetical protein F383_22905 [Gossypium arboreum]
MALSQTGSYSHT